MQRTALALLLVIWAAVAVWITNNTDSGRGPDEIFEVFDISPLGKSYSIVLYDPKEQASLAGPIGHFGIFPGSAEKIRVGAYLVCWYAWEKNVFTGFGVMRRTQCRVPPQKK